MVFLVKFVSLSMGFEVCFYDGMDTLAKVGIQLLFPAYLFFIMLVIIILTKYSSKISNAGFLAAKTFSTLLLLCYTSIAETCILILAWKLIDGLDGTYWYADPTIQYGEGFHGLLVFVAVVLILVYILPFSIGLLLPPLILRTRLSIMLKPLLDAFWNPFKPTFRFWIGFRALIRGIPFCFAVFTPFPINLYLLTNFIVVLLFLHTCLLPFEGKLQNMLDVFFYLNLLLLTSSAIFFRSLDNIDNYVYIRIALQVLSYMALFFIAALHFNIRFSIFQRCTSKLLLRLKKKKSNVNPIIIEQKNPLVTTTLIELRETLLESKFY